MNRAGRFAVAIICVGLAGCGGGQPGELPTGRVEGTVTYNGKPLSQGQIFFLPEKGTTATGEIKDGKVVSVTTKTINDGAVAGPNQVYIVSIEKDPQDAMAPGKSQIPEKYTKPEDSGLSITIVAGKTNTVAFDLKDE